MARRKVVQVVKTTVSHTLTHRFIAYARTLFEALACIFVAIETHFFVFSVALIVWLLIDIAAMLRGEV